MAIKILHTGDLHIGMKFNSYPEHISEQLIEARLDVLDRLVAMANNKQCNILAVAGDLFNKITVPKREIEKVIDKLEQFAGDCVLVLPGNHDYDNGMVDLWDAFKKKQSDKILVLNENKAYSLKNFDLDVAVYPAPCNSKQSSENNLGWIKKAQKTDEALHIGIAHGALAGLSPDLNQQYYLMSEGELYALSMDLWLLGHTHIPYPNQAVVTQGNIFNAGTPEPDGLDCNHTGFAWLIELDDNKNIKAERLDTGNYRFIDTEDVINDKNSFAEIKNKYLNDKADTTILRLKLKGRIEQDLFREKENIYKEIENSVTYLIIDDSELGVKINGDMIDNEFTVGSFPHQFLKELFQESDEEALQIAYEMIQEVKAL